MAPDFWNNPKEAEAFVKVLRSKKKWVEDYNKAVAMADELQIAYEFYKEGELTATKALIPDAAALDAALASRMACADEASRVYGDGFDPRGKTEAEMRRRIEGIV